MKTKIKQVLAGVIALVAAGVMSSSAWADGGVTVNVQVPEGTPACYIYGALAGNAWAAMTKSDDTHYTITFDDKTAADVGWGYKFALEERRLVYSSIAGNYL